MSAAFLAEGFKAEPYWWEAVPRGTAELRPLPTEADVVIVGSGYAGLSAAIALARAGRSVAVIEAQSAGHGASTRSVGMIGGRLRQSYAALAKDFGAEQALGLLHETCSAYGWFRDFIRDEMIDCDMALSGRLICAWTPKDMEVLKRQADFLTRTFGIPALTVGKDGLHESIATELYHGAMVLPEDGGIDPAKYHLGLLRLARSAGVEIIEYTPVTGLVEGDGTTEITTARGEVHASDVILATNAYTGRELPWYRRRVIAVGSHMIATSPLPAGEVDRLLPGGRLINDTRKLAYAFRASPDRQRLLVGGRALQLDRVDPVGIARRLKEVLVQSFPSLAEVRISHAWEGRVGFTFDRIPHMGKRGNVHHVLGCNGSGIVMSSYLGRRTAELLLSGHSTSLFAQQELPSRRYYTGIPWFMPPMTFALSLQDRARSWLG
ncbi:MAG: FAD-binding oxidoreductase [Bosea sp.]|uniref:NAD(P)/FAD-dependent oxidoreductase n=1 Tax=Bosea sp. (in: a-proteobacteria) TaxID=1871050 RepID=UPI0023A2C17B|nr:FAD-binding oxidoreductase [Bosea sp. (in: a-proteobacteria)]MCP4738390.1 FAD-binding oxidoreductase [Bosea sp. (in: a-proteobacteria)]